RLPSRLAARGPRAAGAVRDVAAAGPAGQGRRRVALRARRRRAPGARDRQRHRAVRRRHPHGRRRPARRRLDRGPATCRTRSDYMTGTRLCTLILASLLSLAPLGAAAAGPPTDQLKGAIDRVLKVLEDPNYKNRTTERRAAVRKIAQDIFDFPEVAR